MKEGAQRSQEEDLRWAHALIEDAQGKRWHGSFTLIFHDGRIQRILQESSHYPPSKRRGKNRA